MVRLRSAGCVFAEEEAALLSETATSPADLERLVDLRVSGRPLEHLLGWVEFLGRRFVVEPGVFVPRRRTQLLVRSALANLPRKPQAVVVDMCCGCAAIGASMALEVPGTRVYASDIDPVAVRCAQRNLLPVGGQVFQGELYEPLPRCLQGNVDMVVANAPYVPTNGIALMPPEARDHEPRTALDGGRDGLDILRPVIVDALPWLTDEGIVLVEVSSLQAPGLISIAEELGAAGELITDEEIDGSVLLVRLTTQ